MANISKQKRDKMIGFLGHVKYCVETNNYLFNGHRSISNIK